MCAAAGPPQQRGGRRPQVRLAREGVAEAEAGALRVAGDALEPGVDDRRVEVQRLARDLCRGAFPCSRERKYDALGGFPGP